MHRNHILSERRFVKKKILIYLRYTCWMIIAYLNTFILSDGIVRLHDSGLDSIANEIATNKDILWDNIFLVIATCSLFVVGIIFGIIISTVRHSLPQHSKQGLLCLCQYVFCSGFWVLAESHIYEMLTTNTAIIKLFSYVCFTAMFAFLFEFIMNMFETRSDLTYVCYGLYAVVGLNTANYFLAFADRKILLFIVHLLSFIGAVLIIIWCRFYRRNHHSNETRFIIEGFYAMVSIYFIAVVAYYVHSKSLSIVIYSIGVYVLCIFLAIATLSRVKETMTEKANEEAYKKLAYTDPMTGLNNKTAYVEFEKEGLQENAILLVADMNNLKKVNDTFGHHAGDIVIIKAANYLKKHFQNDQLFRFGGDEFVVFSTRTKEEIDNSIKDMREEMNNENEGKEYTMEFAIGIAVKEEGDCFESIFLRADKQMYADKMARGHHRG